MLSEQQLTELKAEIEGVELRFCYDHGLEPVARRHRPAQAGLTARAAQPATALGLSQQQRELGMLADTAATKRWLKQQRQLLHDPAYGFDAFF
ncbi:hypothetical protein CKY39_32430 [Variovorax boronicumulans]|uniref:Uncharacterized protein n=1 Tax=Variovorax boronicumulans TaxID=436515 RepID=A0A250DU01_9BURK|nr:hypothetical protein CKY39_32430 [Variovorax boronicumulans]